MQTRFLVLLVMILVAIPSSAMQLLGVTTARQVGDHSQPIDETDTFSTSDPEIHAVARFSEVQHASTVEGTWVSVDAIETPDYAIASTKLEIGPELNLAHFSLTRPNDGWPTGNYELVIAVDGIVYTRVPFSVSGQVAPTPDTLPPAPGFGPQSAPGPSLVGTWGCQMMFGGTVTGQGMLSFDQDGRASLGQNVFGYQILSANQLALRDQVNTYNYTFEMQANRLLMQYGDGSSFVCARADDVSQGGAGLAQPGFGGSGGMQHGTGEGGENWQLQGTYCSYSGSSSGGSSYSRTNHLTFDGQGSWKMGGATSFSGEVGDYYGDGGGDVGRYRVSGARILYQTSSGDQGFADVYMRQSNGMITEIMLDGELYSPSLCE